MRYTSNVLALLLIFAQDDLEALLRDLDDDRIEVRDAAESRLIRIGAPALPALRKSKLPLAGRIAGRIVWEPYLPIWFERKDPEIFARLEDTDPERGAAAFFDVSTGSGSTFALDRKALRDGHRETRRQVFRLVQPEWTYPLGWVEDALNALACWDGPIIETDFQAMAKVLARSVQPKHRDALRRLARREEPLFRLLACVGLAVLGDPASQKEMIVELRSREAWRRIGAIGVFLRTPAEDAGPILCELLKSDDWETVDRALMALRSYPRLDLRESLLGLLSYRHENAILQADVQRWTLRLLADRKIDATDRVWALIEDGSVGKDETAALILAWDLVAALFVPDDPKALDRLQSLPESFASTRQWSTAITFHSPPRIAARLHAIAEGREKAEPWLQSIAEGYARSHPRDWPSEEALAAAERNGNSWALESLRRNQDKSLEPLCRRLVADEKHPLRRQAAILLHQRKMEEGTKALLDLAKPDTEDAFNILFFYFYGDERSQPLLREKLSSRHAAVRKDALGRLSVLRDEGVPPLVLERLETGDASKVGLLTRYTDDFTDLLLPHLSEESAETILGYLRERGRRDKLDLFRKWAASRNSTAARTAMRALAEWRDKESCPIVESRLRDEIDLETLSCLARMDVDRTRGLLMDLFGSPEHGRRAVACAVFARIADERDRSLVMRILQSDSAGGMLAATAGRLGCEGAEALLLDSEGADAALGLAYLGTRAAIPRLIGHLDRPACLVALDLIVHRDEYPSIRTRKDLGFARVSPEDARAKLQEAFGVDFRSETSLQFDGEEDLVEFLFRTATLPSGDRPVPLRRRLVRAEEARRFWTDWWAAHQKEFER